MNALRSYGLLLEWQALRMKSWLPLMIAVQLIFGLGIVLGYPLLFPSIDRTTMLFFATGAPTISMVTVGLVALPQGVSGQKTEGSLAYMRSLPVPRLAYLLADLTVWLGIVLPGVVAAVAVGAFRFGLDLSVTPLVVPAMLLVCLTASCIGYAIASALPQMVTVIITQVLVAFVFMFSPLTFPSSRLPDWFETIHRVLPIQAMGEVVRSTLASNAFTLQVSSFVTLAIWCVGAFGVTYATMTRRG